MKSTASFWNIAPVNPVISSAEIHVWRFDFTDSDAQLAMLKETLSTDEQQRAEKIIFDDKRRQYVSARGVLRKILAKYIGVKPIELEFENGEHGKPSLSGYPSNIEFNLSHSESMGLIALTKNQRVGVDVDRIGRSTDWQKIAKRTFSQAEQQQLFSLADADQERAFIRLWTCKEAYTKGFGDGFSYGFKNFSVALTPADAHLTSDDIHPERVSLWHLAELELEVPNLGCLAVEKTALNRRQAELKGYYFAYDAECFPL